MSELLGYAAASAVLASFMMRSMVLLRLVAILSNVLFLSYGYLAHIHPVLLLHAALLPINIVRLVTHSDGGPLIWLSRDRCLSLVGRFRHAALFILGLTAGSLGIRAFASIALSFFNQCRRSFL
jgi:hypothetical protein